MRKLLVKYFAFSYIIKLLGKEIWVTRAATPSSGALALTMIFTMLGFKFLALTSLLLFFVCIYIGFAYFEGINSVKWEEMDDVQKRVVYKKGLGRFNSSQTVEATKLEDKKVGNSALILLLNILFWLSPAYSELLKIWDLYNPVFF